ncbi:MAG: hypothetical protein JWN40_2706, partial [Phycisphaerales bacterium]|nr:hypothetical protein [Phycisphaerales bacterium]
GSGRPVEGEFVDAEVTDAVGDQGPLRGGLTALAGARTGVVAVVTVDMPGVGREQIEWLVERLGSGEGAMVSRVIEGVERVEPFPLVIRARARGMVERRLAGGRRSVHSVGAEEGLGVFAAPEAWGEGGWVKWNCPEDLARFEGGRAFPT